MASKTPRNKKKSSPLKETATETAVDNKAAVDNKDDKTGVGNASLPQDLVGQATAETEKARPTAKKATRKTRSSAPVEVTISPPTSEGVEVSVAEVAVAQGLAVVRPDLTAASGLRSLGLQAELDSLRAQQLEWEQARRSWEQERSVLLAERDMVEQLRRSWALERTELQEKIAEIEFELELTQRQLSEFQGRETELTLRLGQSEQEATEALRQITGLQDEVAATARRLERRELEYEQYKSQRLALQATIDELRVVEVDLRSEMEDLGLLKEDLEETIVDRRRELKDLRISESGARAYAEECKVFRDEAEEQIRKAQNEVIALRVCQETELRVLEERLHQAHERQNELQAKVEMAQNCVQEEALHEVERRHVEAEKRLVEAYAELDSLKKFIPEHERLERRCLLLENDLKATNQEMMSLERSQSRLETEKQQLTEELEKVRATAGSGSTSEAELHQLRLRSEELRESLRKQRSENERLQERVDVLIKAKELEEKQRKEVESRLRTALRIQARQQGSY